MLGSKFSRHIFNKTELKPKPTVARACTISRALCRLRVITSSFDWFTGLSPSFLIGQSNYFGFGFTTLNWNSLYLSFNDTISIVIPNDLIFIFTNIIFSVKLHLGPVNHFGTIISFDYYSWKIMYSRSTYNVHSNAEKGHRKIKCSWDIFFDEGAQRWRSHVIVRLWATKWVSEWEIHVNELTSPLL